MMGSFIAPLVLADRGPCCIREVPGSCSLCPAQRPTQKRRHRVHMTAARSNGSDDSGESVGDGSLDAMRARLEGLFGSVEETEVATTGDFNGVVLRKIMKDRFTVEYDMHPVVRNDRVFIHILWRYYEQVSFPLEEEEWAEHCEAVANLLKKWNAVDWFCDYVTTCKKRPVVGISLHVPIPGIVRGHPLFPTSERFE